MAEPIPDPALRDRFRETLEALAGGAPGRLGVAVSGGADSVALLLLAAAAWPGRVRAATVDHGLRPEAAGEAAAVAALCDRLGVPHRILAGTVAGGASVQARARALRYRLLGEWARAEALTHLATAHHADDQAETLLMRLARGAGLAGLAGVRAQRRLAPDLLLVRPLLCWRKAELEAIAAAAGIDPADDPANRDERHDRTRYRALLAGTALLPPERLAAAAAHLGEAEEALAWSAGREWDARVETVGEAILIDPAGLPRELSRRLLVRAIDALRDGREEWRKDGVDRLLATLEAGGTATLAGVKAVGGARWRLTAAPPRRAA